MARRLKWLLALPVLLAVLATGGVWVYINLIAGDAPAQLALAETAPTPSRTPGTAGASSNAAAGQVDGTWNVTSASQAGYRVKEILLGQDATAVGRTNGVTGSLTLTGSTVDTASFSVDMTTVTSDESRRDGQFRGRIMSTDQFPTSTFTLTSPIELGGAPADDETITASATGDLTLRGVTKSVTFEVQARRTGGALEVNGSIPIAFSEWEIPNPSIGPAQVGDDGLLEFLLVFAHA
jgi:polyisoprenoid-binding protein YceI